MFKTVPKPSLYITSSEALKLSAHSQTAFAICACINNVTKDSLISLPLYTAQTSYSCEYILRKQATTFFTTRWYQRLKNTSSLTVFPSRPQFIQIPVKNYLDITPTQMSLLTSLFYF